MSNDPVIIDDKLVWYMDGSVFKGDNHRWYSPNRQYFLVFQDDGNLVMYKDGGDKIWASNDSTKYKYALNTADKLVFQTDGNIVIYDKGGKALWASGTDCILLMKAFATYSGKCLKLTNGGELFIIAENKEDPHDVIHRRATGPATDEGQFK